MSGQCTKHRVYLGLAAATFLIYADFAAGVTPHDVSVNMTQSAPSILNTSGQPQTQFERGDTVRVRFNMYNGGPDGLSARVILTVRDNSNFDFYDSYFGVGGGVDVLIANWGVQSMTATFNVVIPQSAPLGWCDIIGSVRDGQTGGFPIVYDTTSPGTGSCCIENPSSCCIGEWSNAWLLNKFEIIDSAYCGDDTCDPGETPCNCAQDCSGCCDASDCDDGENCTTDTCVVYACQNNPITPCCGNALCEAGENNSNCAPDCPPVCGNGILEPGEDCDPPDGLRCHSDCSWLPITGSVRFDNDRNAGTPLQPVIGAIVHLVENDDVAHPAATGITGSDGSFDLGYSEASTVAVYVYAANDDIEVASYQPPSAKRPETIHHAKSPHSGGWSISITDWPTAGAFSLFSTARDLTNHLHAMTSSTPGFTGDYEGWQSWRDLLGGTRIQILWTDGTPHGPGTHEQIDNRIYMHGLWQSSALPSARSDVAHEYAHVIHHFCGGQNRGLFLQIHEQRYNEGLASFLGDYLTFKTYEESQGLTFTDYSQNYLYGAGDPTVGLGVQGIFRDIIDDNSEGDDGAQDTLAANFGLIWNTLLQQTSTIQNHPFLFHYWGFWEAWHGRDYGIDQSVIDIYSLHGVSIGSFVIGPARSAHIFRGLTLAVSPGSVPEDTTVSLASQSASSVSMVTDSYSLTPHTDVGELVLSLPASLTIEYNDIGLSQSEENSLAIYGFNSSTGRWDATMSTVDTMANTVSSQITRLGGFAVGLPELHISPDPPNNFQLVNDVITTGKVALFWDAATNGDLAGYSLDISTIGANNGPAVILAASEYTYSTTAVAPGTYTFSLCSFDIDGNHSDPVVQFLDIPDTDADGLPDEWEWNKLYSLGGGPLGDPDNDETDNGSEYKAGTDPFLFDSDADGMYDGWELAFGFDPLDPTDADEDSDRDGLPNLGEFGMQTNPYDPWSPFLDCNSNGIVDFLEVAGGSAPDCDSDGIPDTCGTFVDCNTNGVRDDCDLTSGVSHDCQFDGVPDECQLWPLNRDNDCNQNAVPDECDVADGTSPDCHADGIPDECQLRIDRYTPCANGYASPSNRWENAQSVCPGVTYVGVCENAGGANPLFVCSNGVLPGVIWYRYTPAANGWVQAWVLGQTAYGNREADACIYDSFGMAVGWCYYGLAYAEVIGGKDYWIGVESYGFPFAMRIEGTECLCLASAWDNDCNGNGVPDDCETVAHTFDDCNANSRPDECEGVAVSHWQVLESGGSSFVEMDARAERYWYPQPPQSAYITTPFDIGPTVGVDANYQEGPGVYVQSTVAYGVLGHLGGRSLAFEISAFPYACGGYSGRSVTSVVGELHIQLWNVSLPMGTPTTLLVDAVGEGSLYSEDLWFAFSAYSLLDLSVDSGIEDRSLRLGAALMAGEDQKLYQWDTRVSGTCEAQVLNGEEIVVAFRYSSAAMIADLGCTQTNSRIRIVLHASGDCNENLVLDECDFASGVSSDVDGNGVLDECQPSGDLNGDGIVNNADAEVFATCCSGPKVTPLLPACEFINLDGDGDVDLMDYATVQRAVE